jgi:hypothetical protein
MPALVRIIVPPVVIVLGIVATVAWISLLVYELVTLVI